MSCLMRLFNFRRRRVPASITETPELPRLQLIPSASLDVLTQGLDSMLLGIQPEQGFFALTLVGRTDLVSPDQIRDELSRLTGFAGMSRLETDSLNMRVEFSTASDAAVALATNPAVVVRGQTFTVQYADSSDSAQEPARKKLKSDTKEERVVNCKICFEKLEGPYSTPCFFCKDPYCYDCLRNMVSVALNDPERFPSQCCGRVLHFDAMVGIVPAVDLAKYKLRFEEFSTVKPIYCARPVCSAFLPPRIAHPDEHGLVSCPQCSTKTCTKCRTAVTQMDTLHKCSTFDPTAYILKNFSYKKCPRCDAGVARMFGCPHMRCQCGAHWCWDCQRPIHLCWSRPCETSREDGNETDDDDLPSRGDVDEDSAASTVVNNEENIITDPATHESLETTSNTAATDHDAALQTTLGTTPETIGPTGIDTTPSTDAATAEENTAWEPATVDLDVADAEAWENGDWDFGSEPTDESTDTWGCLHRFEPLLLSRIPEFWITSSAQAESNGLDKLEVDGTQSQRATCLKCFEVIAFLSKQRPAIAQDEVRECQTQTSQDRPDSATTLNAASVEASPPSEQLGCKGRRARRTTSSEKVSLFACGKCGLVHCLNCKKIENKRISKALDRSIPIEAV